LGIRLSVNATVKQDGSTADMVVKVPELVAAASRISTLEPGDIILTGTPSGVGAPNGDFLHHGDEVVVEIERLGSIRHTIRAATTAPGGRVEVAASVAGT
jgi:2-keto-4-pentenoate hydratase/2-oxohepta-3-ene-1,7-dioic acid hydratase in catechol pathway